MSKQKRCDSSQVGNPSDMALFKRLLFEQSKWFRIDRLEHQLKDYVETTLRLFWQRQALFLLSMILTIFYFDSEKTFYCYGLILITEILDVLIAKRVNKWTNLSPKTANIFLNAIVVNTILSAAAVALWIILLAQQQGVGGHFMPLFFLFSASLFAAMNNHQLLPALVIRLLIYGVTFLFIPLRDIWLVGPDLGSELWLNFFTILFVVFFIIDSSFSFLRLYRNGLLQLEELAQENEKVKAADLAKSEFLAIVSHELRTPLSAITGMLELVKIGTYGPVPKELDKPLEIAKKNSIQLTDLVNDLLDLQTMELGKMTFRFEKLNVRDLILDSVDTSNATANFLGLAINTDFPDQDAFINGDKSRLMQMMANLLSNALKFSLEKGHVIVGYVATNDKVCITVIDNGTGIPEGSENQVFGRFSQVDSSATRGFGGTGLGMCITKQIVERHNGRISYESELGRGTIFYCEFDISK